MTITVSSSTFLFLTDWQFINKMRRGCWRLTFLFLDLLGGGRIGEEVAFGEPISSGKGLSGVSEELHDDRLSNLLVEVMHAIVSKSEGDYIW